MTIPRKVWVWLGSAVAFACALALGWEIVWLVCGQYLDFGGILFLCTPLGQIEALIFSRANRKVENRNPRFAQALAVTVVSTFTVFLALHFVKPISRFAFMKGNPMVFGGEPPGLGYVEAFYTFKADPREVLRAAHSELDRLGYKDDASGRSFTFRRRSRDGTPIAEITLYPGKAVGKHWLVDGDMIDIDHSRTDWVTVDVIELDWLPVWLHVVVPR
ncbi:MAG: hypothetical protein ACHQ50_09780 [Fimbriimonadales bacterium]